MIDVVDLDRRLEGGFGKLGHDREEAPVTGLLAQVRVGPDQGWPIIGPYLPDPHDVAGAKRDQLRLAHAGPSVEAVTRPAATAAASA